MTPYHLTHWGRVTHICVSNLTIIASDNGLSPDRRQAIICTNAGILLIGPLGTNSSENLIRIQTFSFSKMHFKISSAKWCPFCLGLNVLKQYFDTDWSSDINARKTLGSVTNQRVHVPPFRLQRLPAVCCATLGCVHAGWPGWTEGYPWNRRNNFCGCTPSQAGTPPLANVPASTPELINNSSRWGTEHQKIGRGTLQCLARK